MMSTSTREYVSVLKELTEEGREASMQVFGSSMAPYLVHERDFIYFKKSDRKLKKGDMVFFQRDSGQYVMHRILKITHKGFYMIGDAQTEKEGPIREDQIFAIVTKVKRKGKWEGPENFWWRFFSTVWIRIVPLRRIAVSFYAAIHRFFTKKDQKYG